MSIIFRRQGNTTLIFVLDEFERETYFGSLARHKSLCAGDQVLGIDDLKRILRRLEYESGQMTCDCCGVVAEITSEDEIYIKLHCLVCRKNFVIKKELIADG